MNKQFLIGIDLGTTGIKTILFDFTGKIISRAYKEYPSYHPCQNCAEQNPEDWWNAVKYTIGEVIHTSGITSSEISALGVSSQSSTVLPLDRNGNVLRRAIIWADSRAEIQRKKLIRNLQNEITKVNPNNIQPFHCISKMIWLKEHEPNVFKKTYKLLQCNGYINYKLTGIFSIDLSQAGLQHLFNLKLKKWDQKLCDLLEIPIEILPEVFECSEVIGTITKDSARDTGLNIDTKVIAGGVDTTSAALGVGVVSENQVLYSMGTGSNLMVPVSHKKIKDNRMFIFPHVIPEFDVLTATMTSTGGSLKWFLKELGQLETIIGNKLQLDSFEILNLEAKKSEIGSGGLIFFPYLSGELSPIWNPNARGIIFGISTTTNKSQIIRAIMEGCSYAFRQNLEAANEITGKNISEVVATGGPTNSKIWMQTVADVTNCPISLLKNTDGAPLGDAILAGYGTSLYASFDEILNLVIKKNYIYRPNHAKRGIYDDLYAMYCRIYEKIKDEYDYLANIFNAECYQ